MFLTTKDLIIGDVPFLLCDLCKGSYYCEVNCAVKCDALDIFLCLCKVQAREKSHSSCSCFYRITTMKVIINFWKPPTT